MRSNSIFIVLVFLSLYTLVFIDDAFAYLDPGSGSMLLQLVFGGVVGLGVILKLYWKSFLGLFRRRQHPENDLTPKQRDK